MMSSEKSQHQFRIKSSSITSQEESKTELACDLNAVKVIENLKIKIGQVDYCKLLLILRFSEQYLI